MWFCLGTTFCIAPASAARILRLLPLHLGVGLLGGPHDMWPLATQRLDSPSVSHWVICCYPPSQLFQTAPVFSVECLVSSPQIHVYALYTVQFHLIYFTSSFKVTPILCVWYSNLALYYHCVSTLCHQQISAPFLQPDLFPLYNTSPYEPCTSLSYASLFQFTQFPMWQFIKCLTEVHFHFLDN